MAEKKKRIRRSREELEKDPNFRDQSGGNRSRNVQHGKRIKSRADRGVDGRFSNPSSKIKVIEKELEVTEDQIDKWEDRLRVAIDSTDSANEANRKDKEKEKRMRSQGKTYMASTRFGDDPEPASNMLSNARRKHARLRSELRMWKSKL